MQTNNIGLTIPEQNDNQSTTDLSLGAITEWCSHLQISDPTETTQSIVSMLKNLNSTVITVDHRFQLMETLRPITQNIYQTIKKQYINRIQPLTPNKMINIELSRTLQTEILNGYKIIIQNIANDANAKLKAEILANSIYRAFQHFNNILLSYYQLYAPEPANLWKEVHIIYKYAEDCKLTENPITIEPGDSNNKVLIINPYKGLLFLSSTNPYQWRQAEQDLLYKYASIWDEFINIRPFKTKDQTDNAGIFFISINEDLAPFPINIDKTLMQDTGFVLDLSKLINHIKKNNNTINNQETEIGKNGLQKLISYLLLGPKRNLDRFNILGKVSTAFGFLSTHYHINKKKTFKPENVDAPDSDDNIQEFQLSADTVFDELSTSTKNEAEFKIDKFLYKCNLMNIHGEGACVSFIDLSYPPIQPGELFALTINIKEEIDLDETHWNIGTVRWLKHDSQNKLIAGLQILAPFAIAAAIQLLKQDGNPNGYFQRALLFKDNTQEFFHLITPIMQFEVGKQVKIYSYYHKEFIDVILKSQIDSNSNFKHFIIHPKFNNSTSSV